MKHILCIFALVIFLFTVDTMAQNGDAGVKTSSIAFQRYDNSYFEKSDSGLKAEPTYIVLSDQKQFDKIFHPAARMSKNNFLPQDTFNSKIIVATIKRGNLRKYNVEKVTSENGKLLIWYTTDDQAPGSATFKSPLILAVDRGNYKDVVFMENGKQASTVRVKKYNR